MNPDDFINKIRQGLEQLNRNREVESLRIAMDLNAMVWLRIQTEGKNYQQRPFLPYTKQHAGRRAKLGYQIQNVDFTMTGRLANSIVSEVTKKTDTSVTVETGARGQDNQLKLIGARRKRGNILLPSKDEIAIAAEANRQRVLKYFK